MKGKIIKDYSELNDNTKNQVRSAIKSLVADPSLKSEFDKQKMEILKDINELLDISSDWMKRLAFCALKFFTIILHDEKEKISVDLEIKKVICASLIYLEEDLDCIPRL